MSAILLAAALVLAGCARIPADGAAPPPGATAATQPPERGNRTGVAMGDPLRDCTGYFFGCESESWGSGTHAPGNGDDGWGYPRLDIDPCDTRDVTAPKAEFECSVRADDTKPIGPEMIVDDEAREQLTLDLYQGGYAGDLRLTMRKSTGVGMQWLIPFPR